MESHAPDHTFVICAYKDSEYLEPLIESLLAQTVSSKILVSTSTPVESIYNTAKKYDLPVHVNPVSGGGIGSDWNFAYSLADTDFVTLAHQDDFYEPEYTEKMTAALAKAKNPIIAYTNYYEIRPEGIVINNRLLRIKRMMNRPIGLLSAYCSRLLMAFLIRRRFRFPPRVSARITR